MSYTKPLEGVKIVEISTIVIALGEHKQEIIESLSN